MAQRHRKTYHQQPYHLSLSCLLLFLSSPASADSALQAYASQPRWGQASLLMADNTLLVYGGKIGSTGGYTYSSAPNTDDLLYLSLNSTFSSSAPPWQYLAGSKLSSSASQPISYSTIGTLVEPTPSTPGIILSFGGDLHSSPNLTNTDSSWIITLSSSLTTDSTPVVRLTQQDVTWARQPMRRIRHSFNMASNSNSLRLWILGGQKADGSQTPLNELWQYAASKSAPLDGIWTQCSPAPVTMFDHATVSISDSSGLVRIYAIGGMQSDQKMLDMSNLYRFTPEINSDVCQGSWDVLSVHGQPTPSNRRGHSLVSLSSTQVLLYGGASINGRSVYDDSWVLDFAQLSWSQLDPRGTNNPGPRWGHTMVRVGQKVIVAFGFRTLDTGQAAPSALGILDLTTSQWADTYEPKLSSPSEGSSSSSAHVATNSLSTNGNVWRVPGSENPVDTLPRTTSSSSTSHNGPLPITKALCITLAIIGAFVVVFGSLVAYRYRKKLQKNRELEAAAYKRKAYGPDFGEDHYDDDDDDRLGLVNNRASLHAPSATPHLRLSQSRFNRNRSNPLQALAGVGVGVRALLTPKRGDPKKKRFDMLADEASDVWNQASNESIRANVHDRPSYNRSEALKKYADGWTGRVRLPPPLPLPMSEVSQGGPSLVTTRGGLRIWQGLDDPANSQAGFGTSTSFLGASLAPWSDDGRGTCASEHGRLDSYSGPFHNIQPLTSPSFTSNSNTRSRSLESCPRLDPFSDAYGGAEEMSLQSEKKKSSSSNLYSTVRSSPKSRSSESLSYETEEVELGGVTATATSAYAGLCTISPITNSLMSYNQPPLCSKPLERRGTWWERLKHGVDKHNGVDFAPGAFNPIRDPAPPPPIPAPIDSDEADVSEQHVKQKSIESAFAIDEYGRCRTASASQTDEHGTDLETAHEFGDMGSIVGTRSSNQTTSTATSSMIEAATAQMVVVQRLRTVDSVQTIDSLNVLQCQVPRRVSIENSLTNGLHANVFSNPQGKLIETLSATNAIVNSRPSSPRPKGPRLNVLPVSELHDSPIVLPLQPTTISQPIIPKKPTITRKQTAGAVGVRAMVKRFESSSEDSGNSEAKNSGAHKRIKVEHGLVKKPLLYVANPDK